MSAETQQSKEDKARSSRLFMVMVLRMAAPAAADRVDSGDPALGVEWPFSNLYSPQSLPCLLLVAPPPHYGEEGLNRTECGRGEGREVGQDWGGM